MKRAKFVAKQRTATRETDGFSGEEQLISLLMDSVASQLLSHPGLPLSRSLCLFFNCLFFPRGNLFHFRHFGIEGQERNNSIPKKKMIGMWSFSAGHRTRNNSNSKREILLGFLPRFYFIDSISFFFYLIVASPSPVLISPTVLFFSFHFILFSFDFD